MAVLAQFRQGAQVANKPENILQEIVDAAIDRKNKFLEKIKLKDSKQDEYALKMTALANEAREILTDTRYKGQKEFFDGAIETLREALQYVLVRDIKNIDRQDTLLKACTIAAQLDAYIKILERPQKVLQEVQEWEKTIKKKEKE
jgi:hypothetical protein